MTFEIKINKELSLKLRDENVAGDLFLLVDKNREHLRPWLPFVDTTLSKEDTKKFLIGCLEKFESKKALDLGIWYEGKWIGSMGFHTINSSNEWAEIGYWISKEYEGKGLMTLCVKAIIDYGFKELNLHRIQIKCDALNLKSKALPERLGFKLEGVLRGDHKHEDVFSDGLVYGLLKSEWTY